MFHQTVTPVCRGMPRISLLCLVAVGATNRATVLENEKQKRNQGLCLQMNIWQHCIFQLLLLEQIWTTYVNINNARFHTKLNWSALTYNLFYIKGTITTVVILCFIDFDNPAHDHFKNCSCGRPNKKVGHPCPRQLHTTIRHWMTEKIMRCLLF